MADPSRDVYSSNRIQLSGSSVDELRPTMVLERAKSSLARSQTSDGRWPGLVGASVRSSAEYVLMLGVLNRVRRPLGTSSDSCDVSTEIESTAHRMRCAAAHIAGLQLPSGLWSSGNRESDLDTSVLAYLALRIAAHESQSEHIERARAAILAAGGVYACEPMSLYWFAALGEVPISDCWPLPVELGLFPDVVPGSLSRSELPGRVVLVSMAVLRSCKWLNQTGAEMPPELRVIAELVARDSVRPRCSWKYTATERIVRWWPGKRESPLRGGARNVALNWLREQVDAEQGVNGDANATIWAALAILLSSRNAADDTFCACLEFIESLTDSRAAESSAGHLQLHLARTEVQSSAIVFRALGSAGMSMADVPMQRGVDWLLCKESHRAVVPLVPSEMSGWSAQGGSAHCIDAETTAIVLLALREQFTEKPPEISRTEDSMVAIVRATSAPFARRQIALLDRMAAASRRSRHWLVGIQNGDGGWGRFRRSPWRTSKRGHDCTSRWSKDLSTIDASSISTTGCVIEALSQWDRRREAVLSKAVGFLRDTQESDGRWSEANQSILPTWRAITGLVSAGVSGDDPAVASAIAWLMSEQTKSGGWCDRTTGTTQLLPTVSVVHTAWAILGLMAAGVGNSTVVEQGVQFLYHHQQPDGGWGDDELARSYRASLDWGANRQDAAAYPLLALAMHQRVASP